MGLTEGHWFEDEERLTERQLERAIEDEKAAYERGLRDGGAKTGWISVEGMLPEVPDCYLVFRSNFYGMDDGQITVCFWDGNDWFDNYHACRGQEIYESISHWMPLPEPPKEG